MGKQPHPICIHQLGEDWIDSGTRCLSRSSPRGTLVTGPSSADANRRNLATALQAPNARALLQASLPLVLTHMTESQLQHMQRVLDAAVINPEVRDEVERLTEQAVVARSGALVVYDPKRKDRADRAWSRFIPVSKADHRLKLDFTKLLSTDALLPTTDNPDETRFLQSIRATLIQQGVWLRFEAQFVKTSRDPSRHVLGGRSFQVWLSVGPDGDSIPTTTGKLDREALLGATIFGAGYYRNVHTGPVAVALKKEVARLTSAIESGLEEYQYFSKRKRDAKPGVAEISDMLGGANLPDESVWEQPRRFVLRAMELNVSGNVKGSQVFLVTAAILTRNAANLLAEYIQKSTLGAGKAVTVLEVAKTAGHVAEAGLIVTGVAGLVRAGTTVATGAATEASVDAVAQRVVKKYVAENQAIAGDLANVRWVPGPKGSIGGGVKPGSSSGAGTGWHKW